MNLGKLQNHEPSLFKAWLLCDHGMSSRSDLIILYSLTPLSGPSMAKKYGHGRNAKLEASKQ